METEHGITPLEVLNREQRHLYMQYVIDGQRRGQAFFNALDQESRDRLVGTHADPFYKRSNGGNEHITAAVEFLTNPGA